MRDGERSVDIYIMLNTGYLNDVTLTNKPTLLFFRELSHSSAASIDISLSLFCTVTKRRTIITQIITLLHVSTILCHPQGDGKQ